MKIGPYNIFAIETGRFALDGGAMFGVVPKNLWNRSNPADELNRIELGLRALLLKSADRIILIDTGIGHKLPEKLQQIYKVDHSRFSLLSSLSQAGVAPEDVTDVILTHLHFDHTGGTTYYNIGKPVLTCPNAIHHVQAGQWEWAINPSEKDRASYMPENYIPIEEAGKLHLIDGAVEILPGIDALVMFGHSPAMQCIKISDDINTMLFCADLIPTSSHIPLPWIMAYDNQPLVTLQEKKTLLPHAVAENWILVFEHDPYIPACRVIETEKGFSAGEKILFNPNYSIEKISNA